MLNEKTVCCCKDSVLKDIVDYLKQPTVIKVATSIGVVKSIPKPASHGRTLN